MSLVDTSWLENNIDKVKIIDCSWHMPQTQRNGFEEYTCLLYTSPSPRDMRRSRMPSSA